MAQRALLGLCAACAASLLTAAAHAHPTPSSVAFIDFTATGAHVDQDVPLEELERALHRPLGASGEPAAVSVTRHAALLRDYAAAHLWASSAPAAGGEAIWQPSVRRVTGHEASDGPRVQFSADLAAPFGRASGSIVLHNEIVAHEVISHYTHVYVRSDWARGELARTPRLAGVIHAGQTTLTLPRTGNFWRGLLGAMELGASHISTGTDHLMFLLALALVASVTARNGRWREHKGVLSSAFALGKVVSAFSIGHSITLALGALGAVKVAGAPIEVAIAASLLLTAAHALRPLFPEREALVAAAFGLIHGLAFAQALAERELSRAAQL
jgi:hypothetical protein